MRHPWVHARARRGGLVHIGTDTSLCGRRLRLAAPDEPMPTCRTCLFRAQAAGGVIYLLHFDRPFSHARHYMGWTENLDRRLRHHANGQGANLLKHAALAGVTWQVAGLVYGDRNEERRLKNRGGATRRCPTCRLASTTTFLHNGPVSLPTASEEIVL